jgi:predicted nucleic-acid-binding Zn-ribbon protein
MDFNYEYYRTFNDDISHLSDKEMLKHYKTQGIHKKYIKSEGDLKRMYPSLDIRKYKKTLRVFKYLPKPLIYKHYHLIGRFGHDDQCIDFKYYREFNEDLKLFNNNELFNHYLIHGKNQNRIKNLNDIENRHPFFDLDVYRRYHNNLVGSNPTDIQLIKYYLIYGINEQHQTFDYDKLQYMYDIHRQRNYHLLKTSSSFYTYQNIDENLKYNVTPTNFHRFFPRFNLELYKVYSQDLSQIDFQKLTCYYLERGLRNQPLYSLDSFYRLKLQKFDDLESELDYLKMITPSLKDQSNADILSCFNPGLKFEITHVSNIMETLVNLTHNQNLDDKPPIFSEYNEYLKTLDFSFNQDNDSYYKEIYFYWIVDCINNRCISIRCPLTEKMIYTDKYFLITQKSVIDYPYTVCNYVFDEGIILGIGLGTGLGSLETRVLYWVDINTRRLIYNWNEFNLETFQKTTLLKIIYHYYRTRETDFNRLESKISTIYGYMNNLGHMLFNDYTGLFLLDNCQILPKIDEVYCGNHDNYLIREYFNEHKNIDVKYGNNLNQLDGLIGKGVMFKYNHHFISNKCVDFLMKNLTTICPFGGREIDDIKNNHFPIFNIVLRCGYSEMYDQANVISQLINLILQKYPKAFFYFDGFCGSPYLTDIDTIGYKGQIKTYVELVKDYEAVYFAIINKMQSTSTSGYKSLLNMHSYQLINYLSIANYGIYQAGSSCTVSAWACNLPGLQFGRKDIKIYEKMDRVIREKMPKIIYLDEHIEYFDNYFKISAEDIFKYIPDL